MKKGTFRQLPSKGPYLSTPDLLGAQGYQKYLKKELLVCSQDGPKITTIPEILQMEHFAAPSFQSGAKWTQHEAKIDQTNNDSLYCPKVKGDLWDMKSYHR